MINTSQQTGGRLTSSDLGLSGPSAVADAAVAHAASLLPDHVMAHSARSFLFVRPTAAAAGMEPGRDYDEELVFLICLLHDLGLCEAGNGEQRFEVDGADLARSFLLDAGVDAERAAAVWTGIALHTSDGIAAGVSPEAGAAQLGIAADIAGVGRAALPDDLVTAALLAWPRQDIGYTLAEDIAAQIARTPAKASPINFPGHVAAIAGPPGDVVTWFDVVTAAGWGDRPSYLRPGAAEVARTPERLGELFVERLRARDLDGLVALYEAGALLGRASGDPAVDHEAIRAELRELVRAGVAVDLVRRSVLHGPGLALMSHTATLTGPDGAATVVDTTEVARRQPDGRWLYVFDDPFFTREP
ncbi:HD domain-containing protein [Umezawaea sp.]|uniref:HD domain-containing protein n=1 Tax=Umezawaea sp. TaxID=1955258 RepID=UPI002ED13259